MTNHQISNPHARLLFGGRHSNSWGARRNNDNGGQTQITVQKGTVTATAMEQAQSRGISMEEVMKDLRTLEEQQRKSQQQLHEARQNKQHCLSMLVGLESDLEKVKYSNGQNRAYLFRIRDALAKGQRSHQACMDGEASSRENLEELSRNLHTALQVKRNLQATGRHQERIWSNSLQVNTKLQRLLNRAREQVAAAGETLIQVKRNETEIQMLTQEEESKYQVTQQEIVKVRAKCSQVEQRVYGMKMGMKEVHESVTKVQRSTAEEDKRHQQTMAALEGSLSSYRHAHNEIQTKIQVLRDAMESSKEQARKSWSRVQELQVHEGQHACNNVADSVDHHHRALDIEKIQESVQVEAQAAKDEMSALNLLLKQVEGLRKEHTDTQLESETQCQVVRALADANKVAQAQEQTRKETFNKFLAEFDATKSKLDETNKLVSNHYHTADYPILDTLPVVFDPNQIIDKQVENTLEGLRIDCENRINSAIKMSLDLREAKERQEQERLLLQQAAAVEEKRKEEARLERKKRLQEAETVEERQLREKRQRRKEKQREERLPAGDPALQKVKEDVAPSAAKPRDLLESFSQASVEEVNSYVREAVPLTHPVATKEKKVHWIDDREKRIGLTSISSAANGALKSRGRNEDLEFSGQTTTSKKPQSTESDRASATYKRRESKHRTHSGNERTVTSKDTREKSHKRTSLENLDSKHRTTHITTSQADKTKHPTSKEDNNSRHRSRLPSIYKEQLTSKDRESRSSKEKEKKLSVRDTTAAVGQGENTNLRSSQEPSRHKQLPLKSALKEPSVGGVLKPTTSTEVLTAKETKAKPALSSKSSDATKYPYNDQTRERSVDAQVNKTRKEKSLPYKSGTSMNHPQSTSHRIIPMVNKDKSVHTHKSVEISKNRSNDLSRERSTDAKQCTNPKEKGLPSKSEATVSKASHQVTSHRSRSTTNKEKPAHSGKSLNVTQNDPSLDQGTDAKLHKTAKEKIIPQVGAAAQEYQKSRSAIANGNSLHSSKSLDRQKHRSSDPSRDRLPEAKIRKPSNDGSQPSAEGRNPSKVRDANRRESHVLNEKSRQYGDKPSAVANKRSRNEDPPSQTTTDMPHTERPAKLHRRRKPNTASNAGRMTLQMFADDSQYAFF